MSQSRHQVWACPVSQEVAPAELRYLRSALGSMSRTGLGRTVTHVQTFILQALGEASGDSRGQVGHNPCQSVEQKKQKVGQVW